MADAPGAIELSIDTAGAMAGVALSSCGNLLIELNWRTERNHSAELLPAVDLLLGRSRRQREEIGTIFVNRGPGSYAGLRVGISTAMGLALALSAEVLAIGRLELDAFAQRAYPGPIVAVHQAGRGDIAWGVYQQLDTWQELQPPRLGSLDELLTTVPASALLCGELNGLEAALSEQGRDLRLNRGNEYSRRAATLAQLGWKRFSFGERSNPLVIEPLYLREAHITQPKPKPALA